VANNKKNDDDEKKKNYLFLGLFTRSEVFCRVNLQRLLAKRDWLFVVVATAAIARNNRGH
jgi:hypothetical protein